MIRSPLRPWLYSSGWRAVICVALALILAPLASSQSARKPKRVLRALGLVELPPNGKPHLLPIAILVDGKFYDASVYKADPVPMALDSETVYEAEHIGVSQGLFIVTGALPTKNNWMGVGNWQPAGAAPAKARHASTKPRMDDDEGPPRLRKRGSETSSPPVEPPSSPPGESKTSTPATTAPGASATATASNPPSSADANAQPSPDENDPNRPVLKRGKAETMGTEHKPQGTTTPATLAATATAAAPKATSPKNGKAAAALQLIPAISDADGPEPRPYTYDMKSSEEQTYRKKMLALATETLQTRARQIVPVLPGREPRPGKAAHPATAKAPQPDFEDVQFRAFDLWNTNEPVFVLSAKATMPPSSHPSSASPDLTYFVTIVAKADIYGELRKLLVKATDSQHLDEIPRMELIDAVDADGDGRGELLFREVWDSGPAWGIYRAAADQLFPLFEGTPPGQ